MCKIFKVVGISDSRHQFFQPEVVEMIKNGEIYSGGKRHREIMTPYLSENSQWIDVAVPLSYVFEAYRMYDEIIVFASGDPLFYGFATTLQREFPDSRIEVFPFFNSLQMLAHRVRLSYQDMVNVSLTGREWKNLDDALISGYSLIGCLTDRKKGPAEIARRMLEYDYDNYEMTIGISLGNENSEKVEVLSLKEASDKDFENPNCIILKKVHEKYRYFGIPEKEFFHLQGRMNMITKMPVRLISLSMLDLPQRSSFWDIGFCTGSVSIEARLQFPHLKVTSFEVREESRELMKLNCRKFGAPSITSVIGDFLEVDISGFPCPDAIFIGGHGGKLSQILAKLKNVMLSGCVIVFNSVNPESCNIFKESIQMIEKNIVEEHRLALDSFNPITILKAQ